MPLNRVVAYANPGHAVRFDDANEATVAIKARSFWEAYDGKTGNLPEKTQRLNLHDKDTTQLLPRAPSPDIGPQPKTWLSYHRSPIEVAQDRNVLKRPELAKMAADVQRKVEVQTEEDKRAAQNKKNQFRHENRESFTRKKFQRLELERTVGTLYNRIAGNSCVGTFSNDVEDDGDESEYGGEDEWDEGRDECLDQIASHENRVQNADAHTSASYLHS
eukprot:Opistho-2@87753